MKTDFIKTYFLPIVWIFLIPIFSYWFFGYAQQERNEQINDVVYNSIESSTTTSKTDKVQSIEYFKSFNYSDACNENIPEYQPIKNSLGNICNDFGYYGMGSELSLYSIFISITLILCLTGLYIFSFKSQAAQYLTFVVAWNISKLFCITQVLIQGLLLLAITYFGPLLIWNTYYPQILFLIGLPIAYACFQMVAALVNNKRSPNIINGKLLKQNDSPLLYEELTSICNKFETEMPNNIVLGIEDTFFVTENEYQLNGEEKLLGKTLYISIFHLKKLDKEEASAIFAHEMAHFSGEDTFFSKKTMPMLATCDSYFEILHGNFFTLPAFYFLLFFRSIFEISFSKISRMREYRADAMAAEHVGAKALTNGLVKFVFYSDYRASLEDDLFLKSEQIKSVSFLNKIEDGVHDFAISYKFNEGVLEQEISHPFDTHPPISDRIEAVGYTINVENIREDVLTNEENSWYHEIHNAHLIESELMEDFEKDFLTAHEENLVYQFLPSSNSETKLVEKYFPPISIKSKNEKNTLNFNCKTFKYSEWEREVSYDEVKVYLMKKPLFRKKRLSFKLKKNPDFPEESRRIFIPVNSFSISEEEVFDTFLAYSSRHSVAVTYQEFNVKEITKA